MSAKPSRAVAFKCGRRDRGVHRQLIAGRIDIKHGIGAAIIAPIVSWKSRPMEISTAPFKSKCSGPNTLSSGAVIVVCVASFSRSSSCPAVSIGAWVISTFGIESRAAANWLTLVKEPESWLKTAPSAAAGSYRVPIAVPTSGSSRPNRGIAELARQSDQPRRIIC